MQFIVYQGDLNRALADYRQRYGGSDPRAIIVHPRAQVAAPEGITIECNGGCLVGEVWLAVPEAQHAG